MVIKIAAQSLTLVITMNNEQIVSDLELVRDILSADASPARRAAAAVLLRAAADAIKAQSDTP